jgi:UDP-N-acetylglucosamine 2-epimerase (non-hydrolysing)
VRKRVIEVIGTQAHFMKVCQVYRHFRGYPEIEQILVKVNFDPTELSNLAIRDDFKVLSFKYDFNFGTPSYLQRIGEVAEALTNAIEIESPELVIVTGDVDATLASAIASLRKGIPVAHIESGLRNNDFYDGEEINRIIVDHCSTLLFTTDEFATANLLTEGVSEDKIFTVGNTNIDTFIEVKRGLSGTPTYFTNELNLDKDNYGIVRIYRRDNINPDALQNLFEAIAQVSMRIKVVFLLKEVLSETIEKHNLQSALESIPNILILKPLGYVDFVSLLMGAKFVITDSGGIQDETTFLGIPCVTLLESTSRQATVKLGTNTLVGNDLRKLIIEVQKILDGQGKAGTVPKLWDGKASERVVRIVGSFIRH